MAKKKNLKKPIPLSRQSFNPQPLQKIIKEVRCHQGFDRQLAAEQVDIMYPSGLRSGRLNSICHTI